MVVNNRDHRDISVLKHFTFNNPLVVNLALVVQKFPKNMFVGDTFVKQSQTFSETKSGVLHLCTVTIMGQSSIYLRENLSKWRRPFCDDNLC